MRALLIVLGIVILIGGLCVTIVSGFAPLFGVAADALNAMTNMLGDTAALEERFCNAGERVVVDQPDRGFTATSPDNVEGLIFCEDSSGNRRDVSAEFFNDFASDLEQSIPERLQNGDISFAPNPLACALPLLGLGLIIGGIFMRGNSSNRPAVVTTGTGFAPPAPRPAAPASPVSSDLARQLEQLDVARSKGLITAEEYERKRQQLLDNFK
jgi:hypothetical protein